MNQPAKTYELKIELVDPAGKDLLIAWLHGIGVSEFVEGTVDSLDMDFDYEDTGRDYYNELGGVSAPISVFKYEVRLLNELREKLEAEFAGKVNVSLLTHDTQGWQEGWKESFKPIETEAFYIYPPWEQVRESARGKLLLEIEPGMAFGTGQHATTMLCLALMDAESVLGKKVADVGTGSGILAIAARKLGAHSVVGTDIDGDAVKSCLENCERNGVDMAVRKGSVPDGTYDLVIANILAVVLKKIIGELASAVSGGGQLILSGILAEETEEMKAAAEHWGLKLEANREKDGWVALLFRKVGEGLAP